MMIDGGHPYDWTAAHVSAAHAYVHDLIAVALFGQQITQD